MVELAIARTDVRLCAARALEAIHVVLEGRSGSTPALSRLNEAISALEELEPVSLDRADEVKAGLEAALAATESLAGASDSTAAEWLASAGAAIGNVDPATPLGLQRGAVQDGFRAIADAVLVLLERGGGSL